MLRVTSERGSRRNYLDPVECKRMTRPDLTGTGEHLLKAQLGHLIATVLLRSSMSIDDAASIAGIPSRAMSRLVSGLDRSASIFRLIEILGRLGLDVDLRLRKGKGVRSVASLSTTVDIETGDLFWSVGVEGKTDLNQAEL